MVRTQIYIPELIHKRLSQMARQRKSSMAEIIRFFIEGGLKKEQSNEGSGAKSLKALVNMNITGGPKDLSQNLDKYLYG